jgi:hypothetical protein
MSAPTAQAAASPPPAPSPQTPGSAPTNPAQGSSVPVPVLPAYKVRFQFVPAMYQGYGNSKHLKGNLVAVEAAATPLTRKLAQRSLKANEKFSHKFARSSGPGAEIVNVEGPTFEVMIQSGDTIKIYWSRDAIDVHEAGVATRTTPLYQVTINRDTVITITEMAGHVAHNPALTLTYADEEGKVDWYTGELSGQTWMKCSPAFTPANAQAMTQGLAGMTPQISAFLDRIYSGGLSVSPGIWSISGPLSDDHPDFTLKWNAGQNGDPKVNVAGIDLPKDLPVRVHPRTYAAVLKAALAARLNEVALGSSWRPTYGSCAHRQGRGLDLNSIRRGTLNQGLTRNHESLQGDSKARYDSMQAAHAKLESTRKTLAKAKAAQDKAEKAAKKALSALDAAQKAFDKAAAAAATAYQSANELGAALAAVIANPTKPSALSKARLAAEKAAKNAKKAADKADTAAKALEKAKEKSGQAAEAAQTAAQARIEAEQEIAKAQEEVAKADKAWKEWLDADDPPIVAEFRNALVADSGNVSQCLDPWKMEGNTRDALAPETNMRDNSNAVDHRHHMHLTCVDSSIDQF